MRLIFIHGINNQTLTVDQVKDRWLAALQEGWKELGLTAPAGLTVEAAYYADILAKASGEKTLAVEMGDAGEPGAGVAIEFLRAYAEEAGVTEQELHSAAEAEGIPQEAIAQGVPHEGWVIAFATALERVLPTKGRYVSKLLLRQAAVYIGDPVLAAKIDDTVFKQVFKGKPDPMVVVGHSLGSVVGYRLLASDPFAERNVPLLATLGSPLSVDMFKPILPKLGSFPRPPITRWINGRNLHDFVTLGKSITKKSIGFDGVEDEIQILDNPDDRHDIRSYLRSAKIARAVHDAVESA
ncbi:hypothetical protein [Rhizobium sp. BT-175]|uniref:hypothetical protein n=1 Tax=Rhizobium sp. BT-175 TaxID=2986929 RepID=UPI0022356187|nr:hypothetical protein [Rhizobium sp. BT-175]MCV9946610.1 hypothetical protein [Rhizobium sp. BT-175]